MEYKEFKQNLLIAIDWDQLSVDEIEESTQDLYVTWKKTNYNTVINFLNEQIMNNRDNGVYWLSDRGMAILSILESTKISNLKEKLYPVFGHVAGGPKD